MKPVFTPQQRLKILWVDGLGGLVVGVLLLALLALRPELYGSAPELLLAVSAANLLYGSYSTTLARRGRPPRPLLMLLIGASACWTVICTGLGWVFWSDLSPLGVLHLLLEGS